ncbi:hypothetical protein J6590_005583 [Homalodisca vitripennis]|nr:hypothetical protein J6590_005583 [Homalodisca vitripennis]
MHEVLDKCTQRKGERPPVVRGCLSLDRIRGHNLAMAYKQCYSCSRRCGNVRTPSVQLQYKCLPRATPCHASWCPEASTPPLSCPRGVGVVPRRSQMTTDLCPSPGSLKWQESYLSPEISWTSSLPEAASVCCNRVSFTPSHLKEVVSVVQCRQNRGTFLSHAISPDCSTDSQTSLRPVTMLCLQRSPLGQGRERGGGRPAWPVNRNWKHKSSPSSLCQGRNFPAALSTSIAFKDGKRRVQCTEEMDPQQLMFDDKIDVVTRKQETSVFKTRGGLQLMVQDPTAKSHHYLNDRKIQRFRAATRSLPTLINSYATVLLNAATLPKTCAGHSALATSTLLSRHPDLTTVSALPNFQQIHDFVSTLQSPASSRGQRYRDRENRSANCDDTTALSMSRPFPKSAVDTRPYLPSVF